MTAARGAYSTAGRCLLDGPFLTIYSQGVGTSRL